MPFAPAYTPDRPMRCKDCGWKGPFADLGRELFAELTAHSCPSCDKNVVLLPYHTYDEVQAEADKGNPRAIEVLPEYEAWAEMRKAMYATLLRSAADLPELGLDHPTLFVWDQESAGESEEWTFVRIAGTGQEVFRERTFYECYERFIEVRDWLANRYGTVFSALVPTQRAQLYLGGDHMAAFEKMGDPRAATPEETP